MSQDSVDKLGGLLREGHFFRDRHVLECYADDFTEEAPVLPAAVAIPANIGELKQIVERAYELSIPIVPRCAASNIGGLCIPCQGSVVVDLSLMTGIVHLNSDDGIAVIEPGVTWLKLSQALLQCDPPLQFTYPLAPLHSSVMAGCLLDGPGSLSLRHGTMSEVIGGMEVLLPDGRVIRTGMASVFPDRPGLWLTRAPLPDLSGLFVGWQGTTGIVTRLSIQTWRLPPHRERFFVLFGRVEDGFNLIRMLALRFGLCDDLAGITWPAAHFLFRRYEPVARDRAEPEFFVYLDIGGFSREEMEWKNFEVTNLLDEAKSKATCVVAPLRIADLVKIMPSLSHFAVQPTTLSFLTCHEPGGLTWVGAYGPLSRFDEVARRCMSIMESAGFLPTMVSRPMKGGHFGVLRFLTIFNKKDSGVKTRVRKTNEEMVDALLQCGFVPYKPPPWAWQKIFGLMDAESRDLMKKARLLLDEKQIMNRGKLPL